MNGMTANNVCVGEKLGDLVDLHGIGECRCDGTCEVCRCREEHMKSMMRVIDELFGVNGE